MAFFGFRPKLIRSRPSRRRSSPSIGLPWHHKTRLNHALSVVVLGDFGIEHYRKWDADQLL